MDDHVWQAETYRRSNTRQFRTAIEALELAGLRGGRLADVGCGSGEITRAMAERGYTVAASDLSPSMVEATRELCQGLPVTAEVQDARKLKLDGTFDIVHCSWVLHWLDDIDRALAEMARAVAPGGALVLQWSRGSAPGIDGDGQRILDDVMTRPRWRDRLADTPFAMRNHPGDEVAGKLQAHGLAIELPPTELDALFVAEPEALGQIMRSAGLAAQADRLGDDADEFVVEVATEMIAANQLNPHNTRLIARKA